MEKQKWRRKKEKKEKRKENEERNEERREKEGETRGKKKKKYKKKEKKKKKKGRRTSTRKMFAVATDVRLSRVGCDFWYTDHDGGGGGGRVENRRGARERGLKTGRGSAENIRGGRERGGIREKSNDNNYRENGISRWARDAWGRAGWGTDQPDVIPGRVVCTEREEEGHEGTREMERSARRESESA